MNKVRLGIIGIGNMGSGHVESILDGKVPEIELAAVADLRESRRQWAEETLPENVKIFETAEELLDYPDMDAVLVAIPHYDHPKYVMEALKRGFHAMCEKPAGVYTKQVREMNEEAAKHDLVFGMMFNQRTNHIYRKMHELVNGGHNLDLIQWICGMPKSVQAFCHEGKWHDIEVEDDVTAYLEYPNGATGVFVTTTGDAPGTNRFEVDLEKAKIVCENEEIKVYELDVNEREYCYTATEGFKKPEGRWIDVETDGENLQHVGVLRAFAGAILRGEPLIAGGEEGINGLTLSNAMHLSSWLKRPVEIPFDEELFLEELNKKRAASRKKEHVNEITFNTKGSYGSGKA